MDDAVREYFEAVERHFIARRGQPLLLSPEDVHRVGRWHAAGVPLPAVVEGIDIHFDRIARRGKASRRGVTLAYVEDDVHEAWIASKHRRVGARGPADRVADQPAPGGPEDHARFVAALQAAAERLAASGDSSDNALAPAVARAAGRLRDKAALFDPTQPDHDDQKTEDHLRRLEASLVTAAEGAAGPEAVGAMEAAVQADLAPRRELMSAGTVERVHRQLLHKRVRDRFALPRLSLFYT